MKSVVGFLVFCELASGFTQGYYAPLLPELARSLSVSDADITWFLTVQTLSAAVCVPLLSRLGDMFGHRRVLRLSMVAVAVGALAVAFVPSYPVVLAARILQGPLAVWLPLEIAIIHGRLSGESARRGVGMLVSFLTGGLILGTAAAGAVSALAPSLLVTLLIPLIPLTVSLYAVFARVPESPHRTPGRIDIVGFAGLAAAMITLLAGLSLATSSGFTSGTAALTLGAGVLLLALWARWELRTPSPAIDVRLMLSRRAGPIHIAGFLFGLVIFGSQAPLTTFLSADPDTAGYGFSASSASISLVVAALGLFATVGAAAFAGIARYTGMRGVLLLGALLALGANVMIATLHTEMWQVWAYTVLAGFGMGLLLGGLPALLAEVTPQEQTGSSVGVYNSLRSLGGAAGGALFAVVLSAATIGSRDTAELGGYVLTWALCAIAFLVAAIALTFLPPRRSVPSANDDAPASL